MYKFFQIDETADNPLRLMKFLRDVENIVVIIKPDHYESPSRTLTLMNFDIFEKDGALSAPGREMSST